MAWFYEIRTSNNGVLNRACGFPTQDAAKIAGREDAKKMKSMRQAGRPDVGRILVGQNAEKPTGYCRMSVCSFCGHNISPPTAACW